MEIKRVQRKSIDDSILALCHKNNYFVKHGEMKRVLDVEWENAATSDIGIGLFDGEKLAGFIGILSQRYQGKVITNLTCGIIDEDYRGKGHAGAFFKYAYTDGDVVLDISPTEQVYHMLKKKIPGIREITDYQLWIRPKKVKTNATISFDGSEIVENLGSGFKSIVSDNSKYGVTFALVKNGTESCIVAYYCFSRSVISGFEIIYCNNKRFLSEHLEEVVSLINKKEKAFVCFVDHLFVPNREFGGPVEKFGTKNSVYAKRIGKLAFSRKRYIKTANRRLMWTKDGQDYDLPLGYLYCEVALYTRR